MKVKFFACVVLSLFLSACKQYPDYSNDFSFPITSGNVQEGQQAFVDLGCIQCHVVNGLELPAFNGANYLKVELGGDIIFAKTYGDLATSILNPDHVISDKYLDQLPADLRRSVRASPMPLNEEMTVIELIDIVAFLNSRYSLLPGYTEYYY